METGWTGKRNQYAGTCRNCGARVEPGEGWLYAFSYYDWDNSDEDVQGSILQTRHEVGCYNATDCAQRVVEQGTNLRALREVAGNYEHLGELATQARAILHEWAEITQTKAITADLVAREAGWGVIGGPRGGGDYD